MKYKTRKIKAEWSLSKRDVRLLQPFPMYSDWVNAVHNQVRNPSPSVLRHWIKYTRGYSNRKIKRIRLAVLKRMWRLFAFESHVVKSMADQIAEEVDERIMSEMMASYGEEVSKPLDPNAYAHNIQVD